MRFARLVLAAVAMLVLAAPGRASAKIPAAGHYASPRGIRVYYELDGRGPALVLLHGGPAAGRSSGSRFRTSRATTG